ncbi:MAG: DNA-binding protein [Bacteroidetes bacterium GWA2_30_7]|nr:MAG: DNA-binding protein [Bacteroidetes bacterium GWA2_30_7]
MDIKIIRTEDDYKNALKRLDEIFDASVGSPEGDEAEILGLLIVKYEKENYPVEAPDPIEYIKFIAEQNGMKPKDLMPIFGTFSRVSEVLNKKRKLTLNMIKKINEKLQIPYEILLQSYKLSN